MEGESMLTALIIWNIGAILFGAYLLRNLYLDGFWKALCVVIVVFMLWPIILFGYWVDQRVTRRRIKEQNSGN